MSEEIKELARTAEELSQKLFCSSPPDVYEVFGDENEAVDAALMAVWRTCPDIGPSPETVRRDALFDDEFRRLKDFAT